MPKNKGIPRQQWPGTYLVDRAKSCGCVLQGLPAAEEVYSRHGRGHDSPERRYRCLSDLLRRGLLLAPAAGVNHVGLERGAFHEHAVVKHRLVKMGLPGCRQEEGAGVREERRDEGDEGRGEGGVSLVVGHVKLTSKGTGMLCRG